MSLTRRLWLAVCVLLVTALGGSLLFSTIAAKRYLEQQLYTKNVDNATALALSMSQIEKDPVTLELLLAAQFDAGHYRLIRLLSADGEVLIERRGPQTSPQVPAWFDAWVDFDVAPGFAQVQQGWKQFGRLELQSHDGYAYAELWSGAVRQTGWILGLMLLAGIIGSLLLRLILRPLDAVIDQAEAIGQRRFISIEEPSTLEFRRLVRAMNLLSGRVREMLRTETRRLASLRRKLMTDPVTGLIKRDDFLQALDAALANQQQSYHGVLVLLRITGLGDLNRQIGHAETDRRLRQYAEQLQASCEGHARRWICGRIGGSDFAVLAQGEPDPAPVAESVYTSETLFSASDACRVCAGAVRFVYRDKRADLLSRADAALAQSEQRGGWVSGSDDNAAALSRLDWRARLEPAIQSDSIDLAAYAVRDARQALLHVEAPVRIRLEDTWVPAAGFVGWIGRLQLSARLDLLVLKKALQLATHQSMAIHISAESLSHSAFTADCLSLLLEYPQAARNLWLELPEQGALRQLPALRSWVLALRGRVGHIGLKHAGHDLEQLAELHDLGLDHLKLDATFSRDAARDQIGFLGNLCTLAHSIGVQVIATGVDDEGSIPVLFALGVDGVTGPAVWPLASEERPSPAD